MQPYGSVVSLSWRMYSGEYFQHGIFDRLVVHVPMCLLRIPAAVLEIKPLGVLFGSDTVRR